MLGSNWRLRLGRSVVVLGECFGVLDGRGRGNRGRTKRSHLGRRPSCCGR